jgi:hypothetical protein
MKYSRMASNSGLISAFSISKVNSWLISWINSGKDTDPYKKLILKNGTFMVFNTIFSTSFFSTSFTFSGGA